MDRRGFLLGAIGAGAAAIAAEMGISEAMGEEVLEEFQKDLGREVFGPPKGEFLGHNTAMWSSRANLSQFYAEEAGKALNRAVDKQILSAVRRMEAHIDADFAEMAKNGIPEGKVLLEAPKVVKLNESGSKFEIIAGSKTGKSFLGTDIVTVGYIAGAKEIIHDARGSRPRGALIDLNGAPISAPA